VPEVTLEFKLHELLGLLVERTNGQLCGDYLEFGVYHGGSMACMYRALARMGLDQVLLFGFDSFEGLPEGASSQDCGIWHAGQYSCDISITEDYLATQDVDLERVTLIKGWFDDTLDRPAVGRHGIRAASVIMIDCDLESSARAALAFCSPLIQAQTAILFDDWGTKGLHQMEKGEKKAFDWFLERNPQLQVKEMDGYSPTSRVFVVSREQ